MRGIGLRGLILASALALGTTAAGASNPLTLGYTATPHNGAYDYTFTLTLTNSDNSWVPGDQWDWLIFGDAVYPGHSPLADFSNFSTTDPLALTFSSGGHNGPTIAYGANNVSLPGWTPTAVGQSISWSGTSATYLGAGNLQWSALITSDDNQRVSLETAQFVPDSALPEPDAWAMMLLGFGAMGVALRRGAKQSLFVVPVVPVLPQH